MACAAIAAMKPMPAAACARETVALRRVSGIASPGLALAVRTFAPAPRWWHQGGARQTPAFPSVDWVSHGRPQTMAWRREP
jgi:hypothetical protein